MRRLICEICTCISTGLYGSNKEHGFLVEEVYDSVMDTQRELFNLYFEKDETKKVRLYYTYPMKNWKIAAMIKN